MSDTPRTDDYYENKIGRYERGYVNPSDFARTLERELVVAIHERDEARELAASFLDKLHSSCSHKLPASLPWEDDGKTSAMCSSCGVQAAIESDIYGLCAKCGNEYAESLRQINADDESSRGLAG